MTKHVNLDSNRRYIFSFVFNFYILDINYILITRIHVVKAGTLPCQSLFECSCLLSAGTMKGRDNSLRKLNRNSLSRGTVSSEHGT